jgi:hypothetical protein
MSDPDAMERRVAELEKYGQWGVVTHQYFSQRRMLHMVASRSRGPAFCGWRIHESEKVGPVTTPVLLDTSIQWCGDCCAVVAEIRSITSPVGGLALGHD